MVALSREQRRDRRRDMAQAVVSGESIAAVAVRFGLSPDSVRRAWMEYRDELLALARPQVGPEASPAIPQASSTTAV